MAYRVPTILELREKGRGELRAGLVGAKPLRPDLESQDRGVSCRRSEQYSHLGHLAAGTHTVGKWRQRFATQQVDSLLDEPRSGAPLRIGDEQVAELIDRTLYQRSRGSVHWSQRSMVKANEVSDSTVRRVW